MNFSMASSPAFSAVSLNVGGACFGGEMPTSMLAIRGLSASLDRCSECFQSIWTVGIPKGRDFSMAMMLAKLLDTLKL